MESSIYSVDYYYRVYSEVLQIFLSSSLKFGKDDANQISVNRWHLQHRLSVVFYQGFQTLVPGNAKQSFFRLRWLLGGVFLQ